MVNLANWSDIKGKYAGGSLLVGNGGSIAISPLFNYESLYEEAFRNNHTDIKQIFDKYETKDFEELLSKIKRECPDEYNNLSPKIKSILFETILNTHPKFNDDSSSAKQVVREKLTNLSLFLEDFDYVFTLNYDLLLYWAIYLGNTRHDKKLLPSCKKSLRFKDGFGANGNFSYNSDLTKLRCDHCDKTTILYYLHGSITLALDEDNKNIKISSKSEIHLEKLMKVWSDDPKLIPLFVCEGDVLDKRDYFIKETEANIFEPKLKHKYLVTALNKLGDIKGSLVIYGWNLNEQDTHILKLISDSLKNRTISNIAVSVYKKNNKEKSEEYINRVNKIFKEYGFDDKIDFFDSENLGCWCH